MLYVCSDDAIRNINAPLAAWVIGTEIAAEFEAISRLPNLSVRLFSDEDKLHEAIESRELMAWVCDASVAQRHIGPVFELEIDLARPLNAGPRVGFYSRDGTLTLRSDEADLLDQMEPLIIGLPADSSPVIYRNQQGQVSGLDADVMDKLARRLGLPYRWQECGSWTECVDALQQGSIDSLTFFTPTQARMQFSTFTVPYWDVPWAVVGTESMRRVRSFGDLVGLRVAVVESYSIVDELEQINQMDLITVGSAEEAFSALLDGDVDLYLDSLPLLIGRTREQHLSHLRLSVLREEEGDAVSIGVRRELGALIPLLDRAILSMSDVDKATISQRWFDPQYERGIAPEQLRKWGGVALLGIIFIGAGAALWLQHMRKEVHRRRLREQEARYRALHDELTQLPNRASIQESIRSALVTHKNLEQKFALMFIDLDGFKRVNDEEGHDVGDELLIAVSQRLQRVIRKSDVVARYGGDEFVILLSNIENPEQAKQVGEKILRRIAEPYKLTGTGGALDAKIGASIGIAVFPEHGDTLDDLIKAADDAMYDVKELGKHGVSLASLN
ncbi:diguanylate cyclase domain-containing protein [Aliidiomarina indica]|uniref:diguanylate cyclase domain-containing protein n=1 Tax=Aliidiomarina indica TaxID=2749147 RepID=UPI00188F6CB1|nr:diguanylate cyclase [Aliidiomarina indica]